VELEIGADLAVGCPVLACEALGVGEGRVVGIAHIVDDDCVVAFFQQLGCCVGTDEAESADDQDVIPGADILRRIEVYGVIVEIVAADKRPAEYWRDGWGRRGVGRVTG
jgi:hypothetical protein